MKYDGCVVGSILKNLRHEKNIILEEMSGDTGISVSSIKQYEQGGRQISIRNLYVLIDFFGVDANTILNVSEPHKEISIDEKLLHLDKKQRNYLKQTFLYMVDHVNDVIS